MALKWLLLVGLVGLVGCATGTLDEAAPTTAHTPTTTEPNTTSSVPATTAPPSTSLATSTTTAATPEVTSTTTTTVAPTLALRTDGLGVVSFGEPVEEVMAVLTELLGPPDWEEVQQTADTDLSVRWGEDGAEVLYLQFTTWDYFDAAPEPPEPMPEGPVFHYYLTKSELLATNAGIAVGSTVGDLRSAYPNVRFTDNCAGPGMRGFLLDPPEGWLHLPMWGLLDGEPTNKATRIEYIGAGWDRTPC